MRVESWLARAAHAAAVPVGEAGAEVVAVAVVVVVGAVLADVAPGRHCE